MLCKRCGGESVERRTTPHVAPPSRVSYCERCGAAILTLKGVALGAGGDTLRQLARFGLANTGEPLLEHRREAT
jgi:hypothetical protein